MDKKEFEREFKELHARFPGFNMPEPRIVMSIWYQDFQSYAVPLFKRAVADVLSNRPSFFPSSADIKVACESIVATQQYQGKIPHPKYPPAKHPNCHVHDVIQNIAGPRRRLYALYPYEGTHVLCRGEMNPVCPECGTFLDPWENPFIQLMMKLYPAETVGWNPLHKGNLPCPACSSLVDGIDWIAKVNNRRQAEARR
ncbi:MAG TPA: hypothetical protein VMW38_25020 [Terriglobia bacterium]|nr:hypothetical protein [Terriglobia bacterium]